MCRTLSDGDKTLELLMQQSGKQQPDTFGLLQRIYDYQVSRNSRDLRVLSIFGIFKLIVFVYNITNMCSLETYETMISHEIHYMKLNMVG